MAIVKIWHCNAAAAIFFWHGPSRVLQLSCAAQEQKNFAILFGLLSSPAGRRPAVGKNDQNWDWLAKCSFYDHGCYTKNKLKMWAAESWAAPFDVSFLFDTAMMDSSYLSQEALKKVILANLEFQQYNSCEDIQL
jgi:hypothetical protein